MSKNIEFARMYSDIGEKISKALADVSEIRIESKEGNAHLNQIQTKLGAIKTRFDHEIKYLNTNIEWNKFNIAFFGETNAGKSTIVESLRIIFAEQQRQKLLKDNEAATAEIKSEFSRDSENLIDSLQTALTSYGDEISTLRDDISKLPTLIQAKHRKEKLKINIAALSGFIAGVGLSATALLIGG